MNEKAMREHYRALNHQHWTEIRGIRDKDETKDKVKKKFVNNEDDFVRECINLNSEGRCVYVGYNERKDYGSTGADVINCRFFVIDLDSKEQEHVDRLEKWIEDANLKYSWKIDTGGGYHYYFQIPYISDNAKIRDFLEKCKVIFTAMGKPVDESVYDLPRLFRVWGTHNMKEDRTQQEVRIDARKTVDEFDIMQNYNTIFDLYDAVKEEQATHQSIEPNSPNAMKSKLTCPIMTHFATKSGLKIGLQKNNKIFKNMAVYVYYHYGDSAAAREKLINIAKKQNHNPAEIISWYEKAINGVLTIFNCTELENWQRKNNVDIQDCSTCQARGKFNIQPNSKSGIIANIISAETLMNKELDEPKWLVTNIIPEEGVVFIGGKAGCFKSFTALHLSMAIAAGKKFLEEFDTIKSNVLYIDEENTVALVKSRLQKLKRCQFNEETFDNLFVSPYNNIKIDSDEWINLLVALINEYNIKLVILDSLVRCMLGEEDKARDASRFYDALKTMISKTHVSIVVLHHLTKGGKHDMDALRGSGDFANQADVILLLKKHRDYPNRVSVKMYKNRFLNMEGLDDFDIVVSDEVFENEDGSEVKGIQFLWDEHLINAQDRQNKGDKCREDMLQCISEFEGEFKSSELISKIRKQGYGISLCYDVRNELVEEGILKKVKHGIYEKVD